MSHPGFFDAVPPLVVREPLAGFLGAASGGVLEYRYADAVKLAGHSCPTVAAAWQLTRRALAALYREEIPERGGIRVEMAERLAEGTAGVTAAVASMLTGAAGDGGFKGIGGHFDRRGLLAFGAEVPGRMRFTRLDTGAAVDAEADLGQVPGDPATMPLLHRCLSEARAPGTRGASASSGRIACAVSCSTTATTPRCSRCVSWLNSSWPTAASRCSTPSRNTCPSRRGRRRCS